MHHFRIDDQQICWIWELHSKCVNCLEKNALHPLSFNKSINRNEKLDKHLSFEFIFCCIASQKSAKKEEKKLVFVGVDRVDGKN